MKKYKKVLFALGCTAIYCTLAHAQVTVDSATVNANSSTTVATSVVTYLEGKYAWITYALAAVVAIDHILAGSKKIAANSTFQLISNFITGIGK